MNNGANVQLYRSFTLREHRSYMNDVSQNHHRQLIHSLVNNFFSPGFVSSGGLLGRGLLGTFLIFVPATVKSAKD